MAVELVSGALDSLWVGSSARRGRPVLAWRLSTADLCSPEAFSLIRFAWCTGWDLTPITFAADDLLLRLEWRARGKTQLPMFEAGSACGGTNTVAEITDSLRPFGKMPP
jgi:hypothetical protein